LFNDQQIRYPVEIDQWTCATAAHAHIWNWGNEMVDASTVRSPQTIANEFKFRQLWNLPIDQSLINDLQYSLYDFRFQDADNGSLYGRLRHHACYFLDVIILRLDSQTLFETGRPISHVIADIIACLAFLREKAGKRDDATSYKEQVHEIMDMRENFWKGLFGKKTLLI
jgi:hypothetical protein